MSHEKKNYGDLKMVVSATAAVSAGAFSVYTGVFSRE